MPRFSELMDSAVVSDSSVSLNITEDWLQGRTVYGGLQAALAVKAMRQLVDPAVPLRSLQVTFVGPVGAGEVITQASLLRQGRSVSQVQAQIVQEGSPRLLAVGIFAADRQSKAFCDPSMPPINKSVADASEVPYIAGFMPQFFQHFDNRAAEGAALYSGAKEASGKGYVRHRDDRSCSDEHLTALADVAPPVVMIQLTEPAPASSINWQLDFIRTPNELAGTEWYRVDADVKSSVHGYCWQDSTFWTETGELAMLSRQCIAVFG